MVLVATKILSVVIILSRLVNRRNVMISSLRTQVQPDHYRLSVAEPERNPK